MSQSLNDAMQAVGFKPPQDILPGKTTRFSTNGKRLDLSGWIYLFADEQGAVFGCWRSGEQHIWQAKRYRPLSEVEHAEFNCKIKAAKKIAHLEREAGYRQAAVEARNEWESAKPADESHPYLKRKGIKPHMVRVDCKGWLLLPVFGFAGEIQSLQRIAPNGQKRFFTGGCMRHGHLWLGKTENASIILLCEGFATADSLFRATGYPVCICFSAGNLKAVAEMLRKRQPTKNAKFVVCGDDDIDTDGNPGRTKATEAAQAIGAGVVLPANGGDFNDMAQSKGLEAIKMQIEPLLNNLPSKTAFLAPSLSGTDARDGTESTRPLTERGNALRLHDDFGGLIRYIPDAKAWLHWRDSAWHWDIDGAIVRSLAAGLPQQIYSEGGLHLADAEHFAKWARTSQKQRTIEATVSLLMDFESVRLPLARLDADPLCVGLNNAQTLLNLRTGKICPATPGDFITKSLNVNHLGEALHAKRWLAFLSQVFGDDAELIDWLQRWCGYLLTGSTQEQIFVFCYGLGANGKSVLADTIRYLLGDYARAIAVETLTQCKRQAGSATPDLADLVGARLAISSETEDGAALAESLIKSLVAGDTMSVRKLHAAPFQFTPQFKLMMLGNHKPVIRGNDYGIWRRVRLVPFRRTFKPEERDPQLLTKLKAEVPHILAWMVEGCMAWQQRGLSDIPATIKQATGDYQEEQDIVGRWLAECCRLNSSSESVTTEIYNSYKQWCLDNGLRPASNVSLGRRLGERGFSCRQSNGKRLWSGIAINTTSFSGCYRTASGW